MTALDHARSEAAEQARRAAQRRVIPVLAAAQILGGVGVASGIAIGTLLAARVSGSTALAGLATTLSVLGAALLALPMARVAERRGRRVSLSVGYAFGTAGALIAVIAGAAGWFWPLMFGMALFGGGTASGLQARFAAADASGPGRLGRDIGVVVWATTIGAVAGPNLSQPGLVVGEALGLPGLVGPFLFSLVAFGGAALVIQVGLRPDPLLLARSLAQPQDGPLSQPQDGPSSTLESGPSSQRAGAVAALRIAARHPQALLALVTIGMAHAVMVGVMVMTPLHLEHGGATLTVVGVVISAHIAGMYAASPIMGLISDRAGRHAGIAVGVGLFTAALLLAGTAAPDSKVRLGAALTLLGLGWSACLIAGSALLTESVPAEVRTSVQGLSDLVMGVSGAVAGAASGPVMAASGYPALSVVSGVLLVPVLLLVVVARVRHSTGSAPVAAG